MKRRHGAILMLCGLLAVGSGLGTDGVDATQAHQSANVPEEKWIWIDLHHKTLILYEGTVEKQRFPIASGTGETPSPIGTYRITSRFAGELGGFGTRFLGLNVPWGQYGIHGTNKPSSIGSNASHGCIRMYVKDSEKLYSLVPNGTKVVIEGGPYGWLDQSLRTLHPGDRCSHVAAVQARLLQLGYGFQWPDGIYGQATSEAVLRARRALGLPQTDLVDGALYRALGMILFE